MAKFPFRTSCDGERLVVSQSRLAEAGVVLVAVVVCGWLLYQYVDLRQPRSLNPTGWALSAVLAVALGYQLYRSVRPAQFTFDCAGDRLLRRGKLLCPLSHVDRLVVEEYSSGDPPRETIFVVLKDRRRIRIGLASEDVIDGLAWEISRFTRLPVKLE